MKKAFKGFFCALSFIIVTSTFAMQQEEQEQPKSSKTLEQQYNNLIWLKERTTAIASSVAQYSVALAQKGWEKVPESVKSRINTAIEKTFYTKEGRIASAAVATLALTIVLYNLGGSSEQNSFMDEE